MTLDFHPEAGDEILNAVEWYLEHGDKTVAQRFALELETVLQRIKENPRHHGSIRADIRRALLPHFPYAVVYKHSDEVIQIIAVAHVRRRPGYWRKRIRPPI